MVWHAAFRTFGTTQVIRNSGGDLARSKEVGAKAETQDITEMDQLLSISRKYFICHVPSSAQKLAGGRVNPEFQK